MTMDPCVCVCANSLVCLLLFRAATDTLSLPFLSFHFLPSTLLVPLSFLCPPPQLYIVAWWPSTETAKRVILPQLLVQNGSFLPHNPFASNNTLLSRSHVVVPHISSTVIVYTASTSRHVRCHEKQSRRWRQGSETPQCLDYISIRQAPKYAPSPRGQVQNPGGRVQDHFRSMARRVGRSTRHVR